MAALTQSRASGDTRNQIAAGSHLEKPGASLALNSGHPMLNIQHGGMHGYTPQLNEWISNQAYVRRNLIPVLLEVPRFFHYMPNTDSWILALKSLVEVHCRSIEGLNAGLTVAFEDHPVGGAGEVQQEFTKVTRERSEPTFTFIEKYGMPIQTFLESWIRYGMADPETGYALVATLANGQALPSDWLADWYSMSMAFIEPDPTHTRCLKCWICSNMMPDGTGEIIGKRDLTAPGEISTLTVKFTALSQFNLGTLAYGQALLNEINLRNANPNLRPPFVNRDSANVTPDVGDSYAKGIKDLAGQAVGVAQFVQNFQNLANSNTSGNGTGSVSSLNPNGTASTTAGAGTAGTPPAPTPPAGN